MLDAPVVCSSHIFEVLILFAISCFGNLARIYGSVALGLCPFRCAPLTELLERYFHLSKFHSFLLPIEAHSCSLTANPQL